MIEPTAKQPLPPELQDALDRFQRKWRLLHTLTLVGLLALVPLLSFMLLSFSDRLWETPTWARFVLAVPVPVLMVLFVGPWVRRWVLDRPGPQRVARLMGNLDPRVGDRLLGAVELADGGSESWSGSPALRQAAILQVASQLSDIHAEDRLDTRKPRKILLGAAGIFCAAVLFLTFFPEAARNSFARWLKPHQSIERFTFVRLTGFPTRLVVPHGEAFRISGEVSHVKNEEISEVISTINGPEQSEVILEDSRVDVSVEGMTQDRELTLSSGDAKARIAVNPLLRPELIAMSASVKWPDYLNLEPEEVVMRRRRLEVPFGSEVVMKGVVSRELASAQMDSLEARGIEGAGFEMPGILVETNLNINLNWVDQAGLKPRQPASVDLIAKADLPPNISMSGIGSTVAVLEDEFLELDVSARDDFGLKNVWAHFSGKSEERGLEKVMEDLEIQGSSGSEKLVFSPERLGYGPGSMIELVAMALDAYPDREPSQSSRFRILVLSREEHAKMLLQQMDRVLAELDESIRQEALSIEENKATAERDEADLLDESTTEKLLDRALDEMARAEQLMDTQRTMESLIGEAAKNEQIEDKQIADWAEISERLKNTALPAMAEASEALKRAAEAEGGMESDDQTKPQEPSEANNSEENTDMPSVQENSDSAEAESASGSSPAGPGIIQEQAPGSEREKHLREAILRQEEALAAMKQGEEDLNDSIVNSLSESFINRFKMLAEKQMEVRQSLNRILPKTIGLNAEDLPPDLQAEIRKNADIQDTIFRESRYIHDDLEGFYRRTQMPELIQVTNDMDAEQYTVRLPELKQLILSNSLGRTTVESTEWNRLFLEWAEILTEEPPTPSPGGGQGGGDKEGESLETMIALIRAREQQEKLRRHTRTLDESYAENVNYDRDAVVLSDRQYALAKTLQPLETRVVKEETKTLVSIASGEMMNVGVLLRQSVTGQESLTIQTAVIELLAKALDQSMGGQPPPPSGGGAEQNSAAMMQAIMQMMQSGSTPGSGMPGISGGEGSTGFGDPGGEGSRGESSRNSGGRNGDGKAGSSNPENWPGKYRGMMDGYFDAMEGR